MRVVLTGATGLLGRYLYMTVPGGVDLLGVSRFQDPLIQPNLIQLDLHDFGKVATFLSDVNPDAIIHAAAEGDVDKVGRNPASYLKLNTHLPEFLAKYSGKNSIQFIHISSNAVFGGRDEPYSDYDAPSPINPYGRLKAAAEKLVLEANVDSCILRPILMYGIPNPGKRRNLADRFVEKLSLGQSVKAAVDVLSEPLFAGDAATAVWKALALSATGPVNLSGGQTMSIHEFGVEIANSFGFECRRVQSVSIGQIEGLTVRPSHTTFTLERLKGELGITPRAPSAGLMLMRQEWLQHHHAQ